jgi:hypothetical protein
MKKTLIAIALLLALSPVFAKPKTEQPKNDTTYYLLGRITDFQLLFRAVTTPGDVTPNQVKAIVEWISQIKALPPKEMTKPEKTGK